MHTLRLVSVLAVFLIAGVLTAQATGPSPTAAVVRGTPRLAHGHPCTLWDDQDVADYKASFATDPQLKGAFEALQAWGDKRVTEPLDVPAHQLDANGIWTFPDFKRGYQDASGKWNWEWDFNGTLQHSSEDVSNLGMLYALTGDEKYAVSARQILLALADAYGYGKGSAIPDPNGYDHFEAYGFDGGDIGMFLAKACHGYDLIYNLPSLSAADHAHIERDLIQPLAEHLKKFSFMYTSHGRWGMVCLYGLFVAGETLHDQSLVDLALFGLGGTEGKVTGGFMDCFNSACLRDGAMWGADTKIEDQMAAVCVLTTVAEVLWHHGVDLYSYQNAVLKKSYNAALEVAGNGDVSKLLPLPGINACQYAFRRYQDPRYLPVVSQLKPGFTLAIGEHLPSLPVAAAAADTSDSPRADTLPNTPEGVPATTMTPEAAQGVTAEELTGSLSPPTPPPPVVEENGKPIWGVYVGNDIDGTAIPAHEKWLGRPTDGILAYTGAANWQDYDGCTSWAMGLWSKYDRRVLWSVAFIPKGANLIDAAKGKYNDHWKKIAEQLATWRPNEPLLYIRTGWEFNGNWFQYSSSDNPQAFIGAWRQFVTTFRSVSNRFRFDWCPSGGTGHVEEAYPGDGYVDIIGLDLYDQYQWCKIKDPAERWDKVALHGDHTLLWHQAFARQHNKPMSYPEWGMGGAESGDDPYFIAHMHQWFIDNHVIYATYWDSNESYPGKLSGSQYPKAAAKYKELFGPASEANPAPPAGG